MEITWHGHATFHVAVGETTFVVDPYFDNPKTGLDPYEMDDPNYVLLTHGHSDHIADVDAFRTSTVVATPELLEFVGDEYGVKHTEGMNLSGTMAAGDAYITMHRGDHSNGYDTGYDVGGDMPGSFLISTDRPTLREGSGTSFYHAGDSGLMSEMQDFIGPVLQPTAVAVPVCDQYAMGAMQAGLAVDWMDPDYAVPMHYDTFESIETDPQGFVDAVAETGNDADVIVIDGDETLTLESSE